MPPSVRRRPPPTALCLLALLAAGSAAAQDAPRGVPRFPVAAGPVALEGPARPGSYLGDVGRRAALLGDESGSFEVWAWPLKLVRDLHLAFEIPEYDDPIPGSAVARRVTVRPEGVTVVYSHAAFTVRQHAFAALEEPGIVMLLDVETVRPLAVHVRMHADFDLAWPGSFGGEYITWLRERRAFLLSQGGVRLYNGLVGSPFAEDGTSHPAHDAPLVPSRFVLRFDPARTLEAFIPIVAVGGAFPRDSAFAVYDRLLAGAERYWRERVAHAAAVRDSLLSIRSPDPRLDLALEWAKVNLDQQLACNPDLGCGLVAGFGPAGPGNHRPGFGWYFGGDAAINSFALDALGAFDLTRQGLAFLARHQRADGKIAHEISHAAARLPWFTDYPYTWYHGDTTPYWLLACHEYWKASGDRAFLRAHWPAVVKAFRWSASTDGDGDGLMENPLAGAGAIEVGGLGAALHTDVYLAGVWVAALEGVRSMASAMGDDAVAAEAGALHERAARSLEELFWLEGPGIYAFALLQPAEAAKAAPGAAPGAAEAGPPASRAGDRAGEGAPRVNDALTVWPATAMAFGVLDAGRAGRNLREIGSAALTTDWGTRMLSAGHPLYEPLHYNNGTVWPFVTGFAALAHYRHHRAWAGHELVRAVARTTFDFARGRHPELLSGAFYRTLDTTVPQQFFASSMLVTPLVRGLLGIETDASNHSISVEPHLPADWDSVRVAGVRVGGERLGLSIRREGDVYSIHVRRAGAGGREPIFLHLAPALPLGARVERITVNGHDAPLRAEETAHDVHASVEFELENEALVEIEFRGGVEVVAPTPRLQPGDRSAGPRVLDFRRQGRRHLLEVEGRAGRAYTIVLRAAHRLRDLRGATLLEHDDGFARLRVVFPEGGEWTRREILFGV